MDFTLNPVQRAVLQWIADDRPDGVYDEDFKHRITARALERRGLVVIRGHGESWTASITEQGQYYLEHGSYPEPEVSAQPTLPAKKRAPVKLRRVKQTPTAVDAPTSDTREDQPASATQAPAANHGSVPLATVIHRPHPAIRELVKYKKRLDIPEEERDRALLILHSLVQEALRRGWTVTPQLSHMTEPSFYTTRQRVWPSGDLLLIDAGHDPAGIRLRMKTRQVPHVLTEKELEDKRLNRYSYPPKYDYLNTDKMRLEIGAGKYGSLVLEDTVTTRIEDKLQRAIERIQKMSDDEVARVEARRLREIAEAEARRRAEELSARAHRYTKWQDTLAGLQKDYEQHQALVPVVAGLREALPRHENADYYDQLVQYVEWAEQHLAESDPFRGFFIPEGERPDLSFHEWRDWEARNPQRW